MRLAATHTREDIDVVIVPDIGGEDAYSCPYRRLIIVPLPNNLPSLYRYLHECDHVENDYDKNRFADRSAWTWLDDIEPSSS